MDSIKNSFYLFKIEEKSKKKNGYKQYVFKDFSNNYDIAVQVESILNTIRQEIYQPDEIIIILPPEHNIEEKKLEKTFY